MYNINRCFLFCSSHSLVPQTFVIWWTAWNDCHPLDFPLPASISRHTTLHTLAPELLLSNHLLFNRHGGESYIGITIRRAWELLDPDARDLMVHCWCSKKENGVIRNAIAHPDNTKQAENLLTHDLHKDLQYLQPRAMTYIARAPEIFK
jgi:hypothetical protein